MKSGEQRTTANQNQEGIQCENQDTSRQSVTVDGNLVLEVPKERLGSAAMEVAAPACVFEILCVLLDSRPSTPHEKPSLRSRACARPRLALATVGPFSWPLALACPVVLLGDMRCGWRALQQGQAK